MVPFCRSCHKMAVSFNPYQANHILRTRKGAGESSPVDMTSMYQRLHRGAKAVHTCTHVSFKTMVALKGDRLPQHSRLAGTDARRKAQGCTRAQPVAPEAVDALTLLMWQATEHREAGFSRTPPPLHHVIGRAQRLGQGAFSLETLSVDAQNQTLEAFLATTLRFWSRCTPTTTTTKSNLHRLAVVGGQNVPVPFAAWKERPETRFVPFAIALHRLEGRRDVTSWR